MPLSFSIPVFVDGILGDVATRTPGSSAVARGSTKALRIRADDAEWGLGSPMLVLLGLEKGFFMDVGPKPWLSN
jgi:hypothetical protein